MHKVWPVKNMLGWWIFSSTSQLHQWIKKFILDTADTFGFEKKVNKNISRLYLCIKSLMWRPWWSSAGSSRSPPGPPWWTRCRGWTPPGSSWSAGPAQPAGWSRPELSWATSGRLRGLRAAPGSPPESCTSPGLLDPPLRSQTSCWKPTPSWQKSGTSPQPGVGMEKIWSLKQVQFTDITTGLLNASY